MGKKCNFFIFLTIALNRINLRHFYLSFNSVKPHFVRNGGRRRNTNRNFTLVFDDRTSFSAKRSIFINQILFRVKRWPFRRAASIPPAAFRRERKREKKEREGERKSVKIWRCEELKIICLDTKIRRCTTNPPYYKNPSLRHFREKSVKRNLNFLTSFNHKLNMS